MNQEPLQYGKFYHIYSHGVGNRDLFREPENYDYFLHLYDKYIEPVANTFAWVLMPNHFHVLVKIKENIGYKYSNADGSFDAARFNKIKWQTFNLSACEAPDSVKIPKPAKHFSHLFNAYAKYYNTKYGSRGTMFQRPFNRKQIDNIHYLKKLVLYIHNNPIHHGFCEHPLEYPWTSYLSCISIKPTKLQRGEVIGWFDGEADFKTKHGKKMNFGELEEWLGFGTIDRISNPVSGEK